MPASSKVLQKRFKLTLQDGLPQAVIEIKKDGIFLECCPLCGCMHHLLDVDEAAPYTPPCQTIPVLYKGLLTGWRKLHPDVAEFTTLRLVRAAD